MQTFLYEITCICFLKAEWKCVLFFMEVNCTQTRLGFTAVHEFRYRVMTIRTQFNISVVRRFLEYRIWYIWNAKLKSLSAWLFAGLRNAEEVKTLKMCFSDLVVHSKEFSFRLCIWRSRLIVSKKITQTSLILLLNLTDLAHSSVINFT